MYNTSITPSRAASHCITFITDETISGYTYAVDASDIVAILDRIPTDDVRGLSFIIFHQPTRKQDRSHPRWAAYSAEYRRGHLVGAAILIEAIDSSKSLTWPLSLAPEDQEELERLKDDGHTITLGKRATCISMEPSAIRRTQLRSFLHELGHHVDWQQNPEAFARKSKAVKESFAHRYAHNHSEIIRSL